jgi:uncharacterized protein (TIGR03118 family)
MSLLEILESRTLFDGGGDGHGPDRFVQTILNSDGSVPAVQTTPDTNLKNPWGISFGPSTPFWVSDNGKGVATLYHGDGSPVPLVVTIPAGGTQTQSAPTGTVANTGSGFTLADGNPAKFIFVGEDGGITGWNHGNTAELKFDGSAHGAIYKGVTLGTLNGHDMLYAADFHNGKIDVLDSSFMPATNLPTGAFTDSRLPQGFAPFNVQNLNGNIFVTYAKQDANAEDDVPAPGNGFVDEYSTAGVLVHRFQHNGLLNSPWGIVQAPAQNFGRFSGDILVGQFGSGKILAFDQGGHFDGQLALLHRRSK